MCVRVCCVKCSKIVLSGPQLTCLGLEARRVGGRRGLEVTPWHMAVGEPWWLGGGLAAESHSVRREINIFNR